MEEADMNSPPPPPPSRAMSQSTFNESFVPGKRQFPRTPQEETSSTVPGGRRSRLGPPAMTSPHHRQHTQTPGSKSSISSQFRYSPGSVEAMEIESTPSAADSGIARILAKLSWRRRGSSMSDAPEQDGIAKGVSFANESVDGLYYGDVMEPYEVGDNFQLSASQDSAAASQLSQRRLHQENSNIFVRTLSYLTQSSHHTCIDDDSLADFDESEWTPKDSAYGAACPVCGCLPKKLRRTVEVTMVGLVIFMLVYVVVTTSIRITNDHGKGSDSAGGGGGGTKLADDDYYIEGWQDDVFDSDDYLQGNDDAYVNADDDAVMNDDAVMGDDAYAAPNDDF